MIRCKICVLAFKRPRLLLRRGKVSELELLQLEESRQRSLGLMPQDWLKCPRLQLVRKIWMPVWAKNGLLASNRKLKIQAQSNINSWVNRAIVKPCLVAQEVLRRPYNWTRQEIGSQHRKDLAHQYLTRLTSQLTSQLTRPQMKIFNQSWQPSKLSLHQCTKRIDWNEDH